MRNLILAVLVLITTSLSWFIGVNIGADETLPGPMNRHRDSIATAISFIAYGEWNGGASLKNVVTSLNNSGLSIDPNNVAKWGYKNYSEIMRSPEALNRIFESAMNLNDPYSGGLYYQNDEKGMSYFYIFAFMIFGVKIASLFKAYFLIFAISVLFFTVAYIKNVKILLFLLTILSAHTVLIEICQLLEPDINAIHSGRFMPSLGLIPTMHIAILMGFQKKLNTYQFIILIGQALILAFVLI